MKQYYRIAPSQRAALCLAILLLLVCTGCQRALPVSGEDRLQVVCTLFPQYDFANIITDGNADVTLILPPGVEAHVFEPTPGDRRLLERADVLIYSGAEMEPWVSRVLGSLNNPGLTVIDGSQSIRYPLEEHLTQEEASNHDEDEHQHEADPHFWLDLRNAAAFAESIGEGLSKADEGCAELYSEKASALSAELLGLDEAFLQTVQSAKRDSVVFGGRFAWAYFIERYGLTYRSVYDGCSTETEPSLKAMLDTEAYIRSSGIPVIFREELTSGTIAMTLAENTGARVEELHTGHNISKEDKSSGKSFIDIFSQNLQNLSSALND